MIARVARFQVSIDVIDEVIKTFREGVIPAVKLQEGYRNGYLLTDRKTGECVSIAFWNSAEEAIADEESGHYQERVDMGRDLYTALPVREIFEVAAQD